MSVFFQEDTISINHNWINGANIVYIWTKLKSALKDVIKELDDLKSSDEFPQLCQQLLLANHGMDFSSFLDILLKILRNRRSNFQFIQDYAFGPGHVAFDIESISRLVTILERDEEIIALRKDVKFEEKWKALETCLQQ